MRLRAVVRNLGRLLGVALMSVLTCEAALRVYNPVDLPLRGTNIVLPASKRLVFDNPNENSKIDREIVVTYNGIGFRGPDPPEDFENRFTILTVGGSTTHSARQGDGLDWSSHVRNALDERFENTWLNNAGLEGHSTFGHLYLMEQFLVDLKPNMVMFLIGLNDRGRDSERKFDFHHRPGHQSIGQRIVAKSELLSTVLVVWRQIRAKRLGLLHFEFEMATRSIVAPGNEDVDATLAEHRAKYLEPYRQRVLDLVRICRETDIEPVLITQPTLHGYGIDPTTGLDIGTRDSGDHSAGLEGQVLDLYNGVVRDIGRNEGVFVIDLSEELPLDSALFYDWVHYTNGGAEEVGRIVASRLGDYLVGKPGVVARAAKLAGTESLRPSLSGRPR